MLNSLLPKWLLSLLIHAVAAGVAAGLIHWVGSDERVLAQALLTRLTDNPIAIQQTLEDTRSALILAAVLTFGAGFLCSALWLLIAERSAPVDNDSARSQTGSWAGLLLLALLLGLILWWVQIWMPLISHNLVAGVLVKTVPAVLAGAALAYYLATGLLVKNAMRPSVPLASSLFHF